MIVIINGPLGIGKTETAWELLRCFERAVMLDGDYLGAVQPYTIYDESRVDYLYQTLHHVAAFHVANGYRNFVINYVFETPETLAALRRLLSDLDDEIYAFRLVCDATEHERRVRQRVRTPDVMVWEVGRGAELVAIQTAAAQRGDLGFVVDTTRLTAVETAQAIWSNLREGVELRPYDPRWPELFAAEQAQLAAALGRRALAIEHIGSTAVPGLSAKPVIDILVTVADLAEAVDCLPALQALGYAFIDYPQNTDRRFFRKGLPRTHHLHIVAAGSASHRDHLAFRDALRRDPALCAEYEALKHELAARYPHDRAKYSESKTAFIQRVLAAPPAPETH
jgi:GrpB-like predicted nucleotidyltransferase (UPF0157 family)